MIWETLRMISDMIDKAEDKTNMNQGMKQIRIKR